MINKLIKNNHGFTLIEISVAVLLLSIIMVSCFNAFVSYTKNLSNAKERTVTTYILQQKAEELKAAIKKGIVPENEQNIPIEDTKWHYSQSVDKDINSMTGVYQVKLEIKQDKKTVDTLTLLLYSGGV